MRLQETATRATLQSALGGIARPWMSINTPTTSTTANRTGNATLTTANRTANATPSTATHDAPKRPRGRPRKHPRLEEPRDKETAGGQVEDSGNVRFPLRGRIHEPIGDWTVSCIQHSDLSQQALLHDVSGSPEHSPPKEPASTSTSPQLANNVPRNATGSHVDTIALPLPSPSLSTREDGQVSDAPSSGNNNNNNTNNTNDRDNDNDHDVTSDSGRAEQPETTTPTWVANLQRARNPSNASGQQTVSPDPQQSTPTRSSSTTQQQPTAPPRAGSLQRAATLSQPSSPALPRTTQQQQQSMAPPAHSAASPQQPSATIQQQRSAPRAAYVPVPQPQGVQYRPPAGGAAHQQPQMGQNRAYNQGNLPTPPYPHAALPARPQVQPQLQLPCQPQGPPQPTIQYNQPIPDDLRRAMAHNWTVFRSTLQNTNNIDFMRMNVLDDVMGKEDWYYCTMHQYYCLMDNRAALPVPIRDHPNFDVTRQLLSSALEVNTRLSRPVVEFFANFPMPLSQLAMNFPEFYGHHREAFMRILQMASGFPKMVPSCLQRGSPPLPEELQDSLGLVSPTFRSIMFMFVLRQFDSTPRGKGGFDNAASALFIQEDQAFMRDRALISTGGAAQKTPEQHRQHMAQWFNKVQQLVNNSRRQAAGPLQNPPGAPGPYQARQRQYSQQQQQQQRRRIEGTQPQSATGHPKVKPAGALLPQSGVMTPQQRVPAPARTSLHQAGLRSPILLTQKSGPHPLYSCVRDFIKSPTRATMAKLAVETWTITIPSELSKRLAVEQPAPQGVFPYRNVDERSILVRIRCIHWPSDPPPTEHAWYAADSVWIPNSYFSLNSNSLQQRHKLHQGRNLPIDITNHLVTGDNTLKISVIGDTDHCQQALIGIETIEFITYDNIRARVLARTKPVHEIVQEIKKRWSDDDDDDELSIVQGSFSVDLFDPYRAAPISDFPVRSVACLHNDCFDLKTYLQSIFVSKEKDDDVPKPDRWRCPRCRADARPQHLFVDGFVQHVQEKLKEKGLQTTRQITIDQDGTWKPKLEKGQWGAGGAPTFSLPTTSPGDKGSIDET